MVLKIWRVVVTTLVLVSIALNIFLVLLLSQAQRGVTDAIAIARTTLAEFTAEPIEVPVEINQDIPINTMFPISQTVEVPLDIDYPLSTIVNTSFTIPVLGEQEISLPIETVIPLHMTLSIPVQETIHISLTYPLQLSIPVAFQIPEDIQLLLDTSLEEISTGFK